MHRTVFAREGMEDVHLARIDVDGGHSCQEPHLLAEGGSSKRGAQGLARAKASRRPTQARPRETIMFIHKNNLQRL
jgi:hypothetical protein